MQTFIKIFTNYSNFFQAYANVNVGFLQKFLKKKQQFFY
jgi:hypothetical protein